MSADDSEGSVRKAVTHGASEYLVKLARTEELSTVWQHVMRKNMKKDLKEIELENSTNRKRKGQEEGEYCANSSGMKKQRVVWTPELQEKFVDAVDHLTLEKAVPKKILEIMDIPWLTRENVASHLQKYRLNQKQQNKSEQAGDNLNRDFIWHQDAARFSAANGNDSMFPSATFQAPLITQTNAIPWMGYSSFKEGQSQNAIYNDTHMSVHHEILTAQNTGNHFTQCSSTMGEAAINNGLSGPVMNGNEFVQPSSSSPYFVADQSYVEKINYNGFPPVEFTTVVADQELNGKPQELNNIKSEGNMKAFEDLCQHELQDEEIPKMDLSDIKELSFLSDQFDKTVLSSSEAKNGQGVENTTIHDFQPAKLKYTGSKWD